ncbi:CxC2 domain-containing protein [Mycena kentingensis (nom. inval.)]|nr:CxC2 domain-containing protein [Mycena kentingensis (nom. inval.)]
MSSKQRPSRIDIHSGRHVHNRSSVATQAYYLTDGEFKHRRVSDEIHYKRQERTPLPQDQFSGFEPMPEEDEETGVPAENENGKRREPSANTTNPMATWRPKKSFFLDELLRLEGLGLDLQNPSCAHCGTAFKPSDPSSSRVFRCEDCGQHLQCLSCCLAQHARYPLHTLDEWNGSFWAKIPLMQIGLVHQIGHGGFPCPFPDVATRKMTVIDAPHVHVVQYRFCNCARAQAADDVSQLLRNGWYPATVLEPATCATFRTLRTFRLYNVVGNMNVADFIAASERATSSAAVAGLTAVPDRTLDARLRFLYMLVLAVDANFRLKNRIRPNEINDPSLGSGWAYWVEPEGYQEHVKKYVKETDMTTCLAFAALLQKDTRMTSGLRVSGVGGCVCAARVHAPQRARRPSEGYCNMDWIVFSAILSVVVLALTISYDIACQWKVHLPERMARLPSHMHKDLSQMTIQYGLPIWHSNSHITTCSDENKLPHQPGVGKVDGEGIERLWSGLNPAALATKEMGLGNRADTIDDRLDNHNFLKNMRQGDTLQRRLLVAREERRRQVAAFQAVSEGISPALQKEWKAQVRAWQDDKTQPNPYVLPSSGVPTETEIRLQLQKEERDQNTDGRGVYRGYRIREMVKDQPLLTADRELKLDEHRSSLFRKIARFRDLQAGVAEVEERLRVAECENSLSETRFTLHGKRWLIAHRNAHVTGQLRTTKTAKLIERVGLCLGWLPEDLDGTDLDATRKLALAGAGRGARPPRNMPSASRRVMSWIWTAPGAFDADEAALHEGTQRPFSLDFARSSLLSSDACGMGRALARKNRWSEEVLLLEEEMRRVLRYLDWYSSWWRLQATRRQNVAPELAAGIRAYALQRAAFSERVMMSPKPNKFIQHHWIETHPSYDTLRSLVSSPKKGKQSPHRPLPGRKSLPLGGRLLRTLAVQRSRHTSAQRTPTGRTLLATLDNARRANITMGPRITRTAQPAIRHAAAIGQDGIQSPELPDSSEPELDSSSDEEKDDDDDGDGSARRSDPRRRSSPANNVPSPFDDDVGADASDSDEEYRERVRLENWHNEHRDFNRIQWDWSQPKLDGPCKFPQCAEETHWGGHHRTPPRGCLWGSDDGKGAAADEMEDTDDEP